MAEKTALIQHRVRPVSNVLPWSASHTDLPAVTEIISMAAVLKEMLLSYLVAMFLLPLRHIVGEFIDITLSLFMPLGPFLIGTIVSGSAC